jgi:CubicO group peptidase (beta-lactamase class C family)
MMMNERISGFLAERIDANDFPSAVYLVAEKGEIVLREALGLAVVEPERIAATFDTMYDVASLTKPLVTTLLIAKLVETGALDPNEPVGNLLNEFHSSANAEVTVNDLMMHTSGLPAWKPFYLLADDPEEIASEIARSLSNPDQKAVTYSDLNFITLGLLIERLLAADLDEAAAAGIFQPLGLSSTFFRPGTEMRKRIAASEKGNEYERQTCVEEGYLESGESVDPLRVDQIWGEVHDGNAHFMGGVAGHAGLFSTAAEVLSIARQFLPQHSKLLTAQTCELFRTNFTPGLNEDRSFGFQLASTEGSTAGTRMPTQSFGHNGFTGTSLWIDPVQDRIFVLLTNRTHHHGLPFVNINSVRRRFHDLSIDALEQNK